MADSQVAATNKNPVQSFIKNPSIQKTIEDRLKGRAGQFTTSLLSVINNNSLLAECKPETVLQAAMTAASMDLPLNQNLGFAYMIPYKNKGVYEAQFQMGWKGFVQLAQRSGLYKTIAATPVFEGQLLTNDPLRGITFDWTVVPKAGAKPIGYAAYFELLNGFEKTMYMTLAEVTAHAKQYSQSYKSGFGPWKDNFEAMAEKTVLKLLLSKFGPLSTELQQAIVSDQGIGGAEGNYPDNDALAGESATDSEQDAIVAAAKGDAVEGEVVPAAAGKDKPAK
jgi:recombination protein RecT